MSNKLLQRSVKHLFPIKEASHCTSLTKQAVSSSERQVDKAHAIFTTHTPGWTPLGAN